MSNVSEKPTVTRDLRKITLIYADGTAEEFSAEGFTALVWPRLQRRLDIIGRQAGAAVDTVQPPAVEGDST